MTKLSKLIRLLALALALTLPASALAQGLILPGEGPLEAYEDMLAAMDLGMYDRARELIATHQLVELNVRDARQYDLYLDALAYMDEGAWALAAVVFEGLGEEGSGFLDSKVLSAYCAGRSAEATGDYEQAVAHYQEAASYGDAVSRMADCMSRQSTAKAATADALYQQGVTQQNETALTEAMKLYLELGDQTKAALCQTAITQASQQKAYQEALALYTAASQTGNVQDLQRAEAAFTALGNYSNSAELAAAIRSRISDATRALTLTLIASSATTLQLQLTDSAPAGAGYTITYAPKGTPSSATLTVTGPEIKLTGLLPDTAYVICARAAGSALQAETTAATSRAPAYTAQGFTLRHTTLLGLKRSYLSISPMETLLLSNPNIFSYRTDLTMPLTGAALSAQTTAWYYCFSYQQKAASGPVTMQWVLRAGDMGVYATEPQRCDQLPADARLYTDLELLLDPLFRDHGAWPEETCTVELLLDGCLAATGTLTITR